MWSPSTKICPEFSRLVKIGQNCRAFRVRYVIVDSSAQQCEVNTFLRLNDNNESFCIVDSYSSSTTITNRMVVFLFSFIHSFLECSISISFSFLHILVSFFVLCTCGAVNSRQRQKRFCGLARLHVIFNLLPKLSPHTVKIPADSQLWNLPVSFVTCQL